MEISKPYTLTVVDTDVDFIVIKNPYCIRCFTRKMNCNGLPSILSLISCCIPFLLKERDNTILSPRNSYITIQLVGIICIVLWVVVNVYMFIWVCNKCNIQFIGSDKELLMGFDMTTH